MTLFARVGGTWHQGSELHTFDGTQWLKASGVSVYNGTAWQRVWPDTQNVIVTITNVPAGNCGKAVTVTGVAESTSVVTAGTVQLQYLKYSNQTWTNIGSAVAVAAGAWSSPISHPEAGTLKYRALFREGGVFLDADSAPVSVSVGLDPPTGFSGGAITDTSLAFSWAGSACAGEYGIKVNGSVVGYTYTTAFTVGGLTPGTSYNINVFARHRIGDASSVISTDTPTRTGRTSRPGANDSGSVNVHISPWATGSYRPDVGWGYIGVDIGQGYYSNSNLNFTGVIDYYAAYNQLRDAMGGAGIGDTRIANGSCSSGTVYLVKQHGVGSWGATSMYWHVSDAWVNYPGAPPVGWHIATTTSTAGGAAGDYGIPAGNVEQILRGQHRSLILFRQDSVNYSRFNGGGSTNGRLWITWNWNYQSQSPISGQWS